MVWPFSSNDSSAAATFEKTLSQLSKKINKSQSKDASLRSSTRRYKALWTLYTSFVYTICALILLLVTGYQRWGPPEYGAVGGGPVVIWTVRTAIGTIYDYRIASNTKQLDALKKQKNEAVRKFKQATRYDSTQELLEKYDAEPAREKEPEGQGGAQQSKDRRKSDALKQPMAPRTNMPPPPTANIRRPVQHAPIPSTESPQPPSLQQPSSLPGSPVQPSEPFGSPSLAAPSRRDSTASQFAPNADDLSQAQYANPTGRQWYDRLMDVILGDDETKPINRVALICQHCKLVNGQAPPGVKEVGRWRCMGCRAWNGEEREIDKIIEEAGEDKEDVGVEGQKSGETKKRQNEVKAKNTAVEEEQDETPTKSPGHQGNSAGE